MAVFKPPPSPWRIRETGWKPAQLGSQEARLSLGNGFMGNRAALEELPEGSTPGTFFAGIFNSAGALVPELVNAPDPFRLRLAQAGEKLGVDTMDVLEHERILDLRRALLLRRTVLRSCHGGRFLYRSLRFISRSAPGIAVMRVEVTPLDRAAELDIAHAIDASVSNEGTAAEGRKRHFTIEEAGGKDGRESLCVRTLDRKYRIAYAASMRCAPRVKLGRGRTLRLTKYFAFATGRAEPAAALRRRALAALRRAESQGFDRLLKEHARAWDGLWRDSDIEIGGPLDVQQGVRFNIYHLLICAADAGEPAGIGAKALAGEGYKGHAFWDTEIFTLPFYIYTQPAMARRLLLYRCRRLDAARKIAATNGYRGAMFPWESADTGEEVTPPWHKTEDGRVIPIETGSQEHHITADIAYGLCSYCRAAGDEKLMREHGLKLLIETARFWASRVEGGAGGRPYEITGVIGPDEFHEQVSNNAYTNWLARWNLSVAARLADAPRGEAAAWKRIAGRLANTSTHNGGIIPQFDGFARKRRVPPLKRSANGMPVIAGNPGIRDLGGSQYIKQADVLLLMYLFPDAFDRAQLRANYEYYESRTLHQSSLSPSIHAIMALRAGKPKQAYQYFLASLFTDLHDVHGNSAHGMHTACTGGTWQALVHGFAGVQVRDGAMVVEPRLPRGWKSMRFTLRRRGRRLRVEIDRRRARIIEQKD
ncbi:MAG: glycosyl hydrolase family 65 protein [Elusimicrobiota bacterium]